MTALMQLLQYDHGFQLHKTIVLRMQRRHPATLMQPLHCDLQPQIQETQRTTHTGTTTRCRTQRRNDHSRNRRTHEVPSIAGCSHFARKNARFHAPASSPKQNPHNIHAAITMRFATFPSSPLPFVTTWKNTRFRAPASSPTQAPCNVHAAITMHFATFPSAPLPFVTTSLRHHSPKSPLPFVTTSLRHHPVS